MAVPKIKFLPSRLVIEFEQRALPYKEHGRPGSILDIALNFGIPLEHACGGNCACTTCHVVIRGGEENLSPLDEYEADRLDLAEGLTLHSRLACQAVVCGDIVVELLRASGRT